MICRVHKACRQAVGVAVGGDVVALGIAVDREADGIARHDVSNKKIVDGILGRFLQGTKGKPDPVVQQRVADNDVGRGGPGLIVVKGDAGRIVGAAVRSHNARRRRLLHKDAMSPVVVAGVVEHHRRAGVCIQVDPIWGELFASQAHHCKRRVGVSWRRKRICEHLMVTDPNDMAILVTIATRNHNMSAGLGPDAAALFCEGNA